MRTTMVQHGSRLAGLGHTMAKLRLRLFHPSNKRRKQSPRKFPNPINLREMEVA